MNSKGFTLIELLASMVILAILMALTIPNIMGILSQNKNANYLEDAKKLVSTAKYRYSSSEFTKTKLTNGRCYQMTIKYLNNGEFDEAPNGGSYFNQYSYVLIQKKDAKHTVYYVSLAEKIKGKHLLIVDDVITTGATVISCAQELAKAEGVRISVLSIGLTKE